MLVPFISVSTVQAEEKKKSVQYESIPMPQQRAVDLSNFKKARVTEEQGLKQLKLMVVEGWKRIKDELLETGAFPAIGLTLSPQGKFRPLIADESDVVLRPNDLVTILVQQLQSIAQTRSMWAVGLMYIRAFKADDGKNVYRIMVMTEHIAGWARHWSYPFKLVDGDVKLGKPTETVVDPVYFVKQ